MDKFLVKLPQNSKKRKHAAIEKSVQNNGFQMCLDVGQVKFACFLGILSHSGLEELRCEFSLYKMRNGLRSRGPGGRAATRQLLWESKQNRRHVISFNSSLLFAVE